MTSKRNKTTSLSRTHPPPHIFSPHTCTCTHTHTHTRTRRKEARNLLIFCSLKWPALSGQPQVTPSLKGMTRVGEKKRLTPIWSNFQPIECWGTSSSGSTLHWELLPSSVSTFLADWRIHDKVSKRYASLPMLWEIAQLCCLGWNRLSLSLSRHFITDWKSSC